MIEHYIALVVSDELDSSIVKKWFACVREDAPAGTVCTTLVDGTAVSLIKSKDKDGCRYAVPLTRDLTDSEVQKILESFTVDYPKEFDIEATSMMKDKPTFTTEIEVDHAPLIALCTSWAKGSHDSWLKDKVADGWRYGPTASKINKTHPLIRSWEELPDEYRKVDYEKPQKLLNMLLKSGYVMVRKDELDKLLGDE